ncbi:hypothetical protein TWF281_005473 [Arthrobotrys megalospora]
MSSDEATLEFSEAGNWPLAEATQIQEAQNLATLVESDKQKHKFWMKQPGLRNLNYAIGTLYMSAAANGYDSSVVGGLLTLDIFRNIFGIANFFPLRVFIMTTALPLGALLTLMPGAWMGDRLGRHPVLMIGSTLMAVGAIAQGCTKGVGPFIITRLIIGMGLGFNQTSAPTLAVEIAHPRQRDVVGIFYNVFWYLGSVISAIATFVATKYQADSDWGWRVPCFVQAIFPIIQLASYSFIPESPRYLFAVKEDEKAEHMIRKYHKCTGHPEDIELIEAEIRTIKETLRSEEFAMVQQRNSEKLELDSYEFQGKAAPPQFREFFSCQANMHRLFICIAVGIMIQFAGNGVISWYLYPTLNTLEFRNQTQAAGFNIGLQAWNLAWATVGAIISTRLGRRMLWLATTVGMMVPLLAMAIIMSQVSKKSKTGVPTPVEGYSAMVSVLMFWAIYDVAYTPLQVGYVQEILPYRLRSTGVALNWTAVMAFGICQQFTTPLGFLHLKWGYFLLHIGFLAIFAAVIIGLFAETRDITINMSQYLFDKQHKNLIDDHLEKVAEKRSREKAEKEAKERRKRLAKKRNKRRGQAGAPVQRDEEATRPPETRANSHGAEPEEYTYTSDGLEGWGYGFGYPYTGQGHIY